MDKPAKDPDQLAKNRARVVKLRTRRAQEGWKQLAVQIPPEAVAALEDAAAARPADTLPQLLTRALVLLARDIRRKR